MKQHQAINFIYCTFNNIICNEGPGGGAIAFDDDGYTNYNTDLIIQGYNFGNVHCSSNRGGAIYFKSSSKLLIKHCTFINVSSSSIGGAIYYVSESELTIENCTFNDISSKDVGGAIYSSSPNGKMIINNCKFNNVTSDLNGHTIYIGNKDLSITLCTFTDCKKGTENYSIFLAVTILEFYYNTFTFAETNEDCCCIHIEKAGNYKFFGNTFTNARINGEKEKSAGINVAYIKDQKFSMTIENNTFDHISGQYRGRCFYISDDQNSDLIIKNNTIKNCPKGGPLFAVFFKIYQEVFLLDSINFINNEINDIYDSKYGSTPQVWIENQILMNWDYGYKLNLTFSECNFIENISPKDGSALNFGANRYFSDYNIHLYKCNFIDNKAEVGGNVLLIQTYESFICEECFFRVKKDNNDESESVRVNTKFICKNPDLGGNLIPPADLYIDQYIAFMNCNFEDTTQKFAHEILIDESPNTPIIFSECHFTDCVTNGYIILVNNPVDDLQIKNCTFNFSDLDHLAPAIYSNSNNILLFGNVFTKCAIHTIEISSTLDKNPVKLIENTFIDICKGELMDITFYMKPEIEGNIFINASLNDPLFQFHLKNAFNSISFIRNTFSNFDMTVESGGIGIEIENDDTNNALNLLYENCTFYKNTNKNNVNPAGALHCGTYQNKGNVIYTISECIFQENYNNDKGGSLFINIINEVLIEKCTFIDNSTQLGSSIYINPDYQDVKTSSTININQCDFLQNKAEKSASVFIGPGSTKSVKINYCTFKEDNGVVIDNLQNEIECESNTFLDSLKEPSLKITQSNGYFKNHITIDFCVFDSCHGDINKCFYLDIKTRYIQFQNCVIQNMQETGVNNYIGTIDAEETSLNFDNISFINNSCDCLYGGGVGLMFIELNEIAFMECKFINNTAIQNQTLSRPYVVGKNYFNGDGGAIQLGYLCKTNDVNIEFTGCEFRNNKAHRHGGAIAFQTYYLVIIKYCTFINNIANAGSSSSQLLYNNNYFDMKDQGRGGAIYLNPTYSYDSLSSCNPPENTMQYKIENCNFKMNNAHDGYSIYIEGDNPLILLDMKENIFTDNYNEKNHPEGSNNFYGAVITTEICIIEVDKIIIDNKFNYSSNVNVKEVSCVDHSGNTNTVAFSNSDEFSQSNLFPFSHSAQVTLTPESTSDDSSNEEEISTTTELAFSDASDSMFSNEASESSTLNEEDKSSSMNEEEKSSSMNEEEKSSSMNEEEKSSSMNEEDKSSSMNEEEKSSSINEAATSSEKESSSTSSEISEPNLPSNDVGESTPPLEPSGGPSPDDTLCAVIHNNAEEFLQHRCEFSSDGTDSNSYIKVIQSNFADFKNESHGGAILIYNSGFIIHGVNFTRCTSEKGGGGAIYILDSRTLIYNITIDLCFFTECSACYGGACYIFSGSEMNDVTITNCTFRLNIATKLNGNKDSDDEFFGGSSIFMTAKNASIKNSRFEKNVGSKGAIKITNKFDILERSIKMLNIYTFHSISKQNSILISECTFDESGKSGASIYFVSENDVGDVDINNYKFNGKLSHGKHHIDGKLLSSKKPQLCLNSCEFASKAEFAVNKALMKETITKKKIQTPAQNANATFLLFSMIIIALAAAVCMTMKLRRTNWSIISNEEVGVQQEYDDELFNQMICSTIRDNENPLV